MKKKLTFLLPLLIILNCKEEKTVAPPEVVYDLQGGYKAFINDTINHTDSLAKEQAIYLAKNYGEDGISMHAMGIKKWLKNNGLDYDSIHGSAIEELHKNDKKETYVGVEGNSDNAYEKIHIAFEGMPDKNVVKPLLESVMKRYKIIINNKNVEGCANVLVLQKNESKVGVSEMEILKDMYQNGDPKNTFPEQAVYSALYLEQTK